MKKKTRTTKSKKDKKNLLSIVVAVLLVLVGVTVAYAALSQVLNITISKVTQQGIEGGWNVAFETGSVTATVGGTSSQGRSCGTATVTTDTVTVGDTQLSKPDDSCTYELTVKNTGGIDATLATITPNAPTSISCTNSGASMVCGNITYKLTTDAAGTTLLTTGGDLVKTTGTQTIYLVVKHTGSGTSSATIEQSNGGFTLVYNQK